MSSCKETSQATDKVGNGSTTANTAITVTTSDESSPLSVRPMYGYDATTQQIVHVVDKDLLCIPFNRPLGCDLEKCTRQHLEMQDCHFYEQRRCRHGWCLFRHRKSGAAVSHITRLLKQGWRPTQEDKERTNLTLLKQSTQTSSDEPSLERPALLLAPHSSALHGIAAVSAEAQQKLTTTTTTTMTTTVTSASTTKDVQMPQHQFGFGFLPLPSKPTGKCRTCGKEIEERFKMEDEFCRTCHRQLPRKDMSLPTRLLAVPSPQPQLEVSTASSPAAGGPTTVQQTPASHAVGAKLPSTTSSKASMSQDATPKVIPISVPTDMLAPADVPTPQTKANSEIAATTTTTAEAEAEAGAHKHTPQVHKAPASSDKSKNHPSPHQTGIQQQHTQHRSPSTPHSHGPQHHGHHHHHHQQQQQQQQQHHHHHQHHHNTYRQRQQHPTHSHDAPRAPAIPHSWIYSDPVFVKFEVPVFGSSPMVFELEQRLRFVSTHDKDSVECLDCCDQSTWGSASSTTTSSSASRSYAYAHSSYHHQRPWRETYIPPRPHSANPYAHSYHAGHDRSRNSSDGSDEAAFVGSMESPAAMSMGMMMDMSMGIPVPYPAMMNMYGGYAPYYMANTMPMYEPDAAAYTRFGALSSPHVLHSYAGATPSSATSASLAASVVSEAATEQEQETEPLEDKAAPTPVVVAGAAAAATAAVTPARTSSASVPENKERTHPTPPSEAVVQETDANEHQEEQEREAEGDGDENDDDSEEAQKHSDH